MDELRCSNGLRFSPFLFKAATSFSLIVRLFKYPGCVQDRVVPFYIRLPVVCGAIGSLNDLPD